MRRAPLLELNPDSWTGNSGFQSNFYLGVISVKYTREREEATRLFEQGWGARAVASRLGLHRRVVQRWEYAWRALGEEARLPSHRQYSQDEKVRAARMVADEGIPKPQVMEAMGIRSLSALDRWVRAYRGGGPDALAPRPRGRPGKASPPTYATREEELEARVRELELELEIQKRINALADGLKPR